MYSAILANLARHIRLTPTEEARFTALLVPEHLARLAYVLQPGQPARYLSFVAQGCVHTFLVDAQAKEYVLAFAINGRFPPRAGQ